MAVSFRERRIQVIDLPEGDGISNVLEENSDVQAGESVVTRPEAFTGVFTCRNAFQ